MLGSWRLNLWVPRARFPNVKKAAREFQQGQLPLVFAEKELAAASIDALNDQVPRLVCDSYLEALAAMQQQELGSVLPDFLAVDAERFMAVRLSALEAVRFQYGLAWNPRLLRLNPQAIRRRDFLVEMLARTS